VSRPGVDVGAPVRILDRVARTAAVSAFPGSERLKPYVSRLAIEWLREHPEVRHRQIEGTLVFVDIAGFTSLTDQLSKKGKVGAEEMNDVLDATFTELLSVAYDHGAGVIKWGGDAVLLLFSGQGHAERGCRAAWEMQNKMRSVGRLRTSAGRVTLRMSVGIHSGSYDFFFVGKIHRELVVVGAAADRLVEAETAAEAGEIVVTSATATALPDARIGVPKGPGFLLRCPPTLEIDRTPPVGEVGDVDLRRCVPAAVASHLVEGGGEAEHRPLTIAFLQFGGVNELLASEGGNALAEALEECLDAVEGIALEHKVAFFDTDIAAGGGKIMLVSGAPTSSGNDEERMLRALRAIADSQLPLPLQIGVHRGRILAADFGPPYRRTYSFKGDAANLAARLMAKATSGQILATAEVLTRSRTEFHAEPLEPFPVKGKAEPVQAFALGAAAGVRARRAEAPLVGREEELRTLLERVEVARRYEGGIVELVGDPGMGKSRLIEELGAHVGRDAFISIQCDEYEATTPYHPFRLLLDFLLASPGERGKEITPARLRRHVERAAPHLLPWLPLVAVPLGLEVPDTEETAPLAGEFRKRRLEEVVADFIGMLLLVPTVIVFEDVHWLDEASADLLSHLSLTLYARPWLVVATRRDRPTTFSVPEQASPRQIWLEPLTGDASAALIEQSLAELPLTTRQVEDLAARAGGNPLFLTELLGAAQSAEGLEELPDSVEALLIREIDRLSPPARRMLRSAAVIGAAFERDLLRTCLGEAWDDKTWSSLEDFLVPQGGDAYRFRHMMARDTAYEGLPYRRRRELHERVGLTIKERAHRAEHEAALLSLHFFHAHDFEHAWRYSRIAGEQAQAMYANHDAAAFYERALASARRIRLDAVDFANVSEALGDVRLLLGEFRQAGSAFRTARARLGDDSVEQARLMLKEAMAPWGLGNYRQALRWLTRGLRTLDGREDEEAITQRAALAAWYGAVRWKQGRSLDAIAWSQTAIEAAEQSDARGTLAHAYRVLDIALVSQGRYEEAVYSRRALAIYEQLGDLHRQGITLNNIGTSLYFLGRWDETIEAYEAAQQALEKAGDQWLASFALTNRAELLSDQGRREEAEPLLRQALRVARASATGPHIANILADYGRLTARAGRFDEAAAMLNDARSEYERAGERGEVLLTDAKIAECLMLEGEGQAALELASSTLLRAESLEGVYLVIPTLLRVKGCALAQLDRVDEAWAALLESLAAARAKEADYELALTMDALVTLGRVTGRPIEELVRERDPILERLGVVATPETPLPCTLSTSA
jgi:class 3 adenylate cyclase/tetratricopeptide (TPR) repeat protein